ncbi:MAG: glutathione peroxidase [Planctomycetota bacterium]
METIRLALPVVLSVLLLAGCSGPTTSKSVVQSDERPALLGEFEVRTLEGQPVSLEAWRGRVVLVVNTASECGYTPQYSGLEALHQELGPRGFEVLGFPSNDFGGQEPGDAGQIRTFCTDRFQVTFPLFEKVSVKAGSGQAPLFAWLQASTGQVPNWNFCKYLVGRDGKPIRFWSSKTTPEDPELRAAIESAISAQ